MKTNWWCSVVLHPRESEYGFFTAGRNAQSSHAQWINDYEELERVLVIPAVKRQRVYVGYRSIDERQPKAVVYLRVGKGPSYMEGDWSMVGYYGPERAKTVALAFIRMFT